MFYGICVLQLVSLLAVQTTTTSAVSDVHVPRETEPKTSQWCIIWPDMRVPVGTTWKERCRKCKCVGNSHIVCKGGPKCNNPYKPYHEDFCGKVCTDKSAYYYYYYCYCCYCYYYYYYYYYCYYYGVIIVIIISLSTLFMHISIYMYKLHYNVENKYVLYVLLSFCKT